MKKHKILSVLAAVFSAALLLGLAVSCGDDEGDKGNEPALLYSLSVGGIEAESIPTAISQGQIYNEDFLYDVFNSTPAYTGEVLMGAEENLKNAYVSATVSAGATVAYGIWKGDPPGFPGTSEVFSSTDIYTFAKTDKLGVRVTSASGNVSNYYCFALTTESADVNITSIVVAGTTFTGPSQIGQGSEIHNQQNSWGKISIPYTKSQNANFYVIPRNPNVGSVKFVQADGNTSNPPEANFVELTKGTLQGTTTVIFSGEATFTHGNNSWFLISSDDAKKYYRQRIEVGNDATLKSVMIGEEAAELGTPKDALTGSPAANLPNFTTAQKGALQPVEYQTTEGYVIDIVATDEEAAIKWLPDVTPTTPAINGIEAQLEDYEKDTARQFTPNSDIVIKVTSGNGLQVRYYRINLITKNFTEISKGTPKLNTDDWLTANSTEDKSKERHIDDIWDDAVEVFVERVNRGEPYEAWFAYEGNQHTSAKVKLLWDDTGIWSYWDVDYHEFYTTNPETMLEKTTVLTTPVSPGSVPDGAHEKDSIEFFLNETYQKNKSGAWGNQFRVSPNNVLSGDFSGGATNDDSTERTKFQNAGNTRAWIKYETPGDSTSKEIGYVVIMHAFFNQQENADANAVFQGTTGSKTVKEGAFVGLELQLNACSTAVATAGKRDGILTWNGILGLAYRNVGNYGVAKLVTNLTPPAPNP